MKKTLIGFVALALVVAAPPAAVAKHGKGHDVKNAARFCRDLRQSLTPDIFRQTYGGGSNAFGKCVSQRVRELKAARREARQACRSELGQARFRHRGGPNRGAFAKCVRAKLRQATAHDDDDVLNAAKECKAERDDDPGAFEDNYGTNENKRNAFGKCVSSHANDDQDENEPQDEPEAGNDQAEPGEAPEPKDD